MSNEDLELRDYFAGQAMNALIHRWIDEPLYRIHPNSSVDPQEIKPNAVIWAEESEIETVMPSYKEIVETAYKISDAMMGEREKEPNGQNVEAQEGSVSGTVETS